MQKPADPRAREEALARADAELNELRRQRKPPRRWSSWFEEDHPVEIVLMWFVTTFTTGKILGTLFVTLAVVLMVMEACT